MRFFDSHAHLNLTDYDGDRTEAIARARKLGVTRIVNVGIDAPTAREALALAREHSGLYATAAVHPNYVARAGDAGFEEVATLLCGGGFVAVGETGLDFYRDHCPPALQREYFVRHIELADELGLPVVVHCREAYDACYEVIEKESRRRNLDGRIIMHCFGGSAEEARRFVDLGAWISFSGVITFPNASSVRAAAKVVPLEKTLAETDCPWLAPQAHRGRRNEPGHVIHVVSELAKVHGVEPEEAARITTENAKRVFAIEGEL
jgi:TatD DNase family protein